MASAFAHGLVAITLGKIFALPVTSTRFWLLAIACSILPDIDVIGFKLGIPYEHVLGHRGITHSLSFALLVGLLVTRLGFSQWRISSRTGIGLVIFFTLATASHGLLDALTNGGLGIAFLAPFDNSRYFFPWQPIQVPPIGIERFFSDWGLAVIQSEIVWIGIPCVGILLLSYILRKKPAQQATENAL